jgi:DNA-binding transcriptional LysR family regulator
MLMEAAADGLGITLLPLFHAAPFLHKGRVRRVLAEWSFPVSLYAVFPHARHLSAKVRVFIDFLVETFFDPPWSAPLKVAPSPITS